MRKAPPIWGRSRTARPKTIHPRVRRRKNSQVEGYIADAKKLQTQANLKTEGHYKASEEYDSTMMPDVMEQYFKDNDIEYDDRASRPGRTAASGSGRLTPLKIGRRRWRYPRIWMPTGLPTAPVPARMIWTLRSSPCKRIRKPSARTSRRRWFTRRTSWGSTIRLRRARTRPSSPTYRRSPA